MNVPGPRLVTGPLSRAELTAMAEAGFGDMVKAVVDVARGVMAIGGELHSDEEALLIENRSQRSDLWGISLYRAKGCPTGSSSIPSINVRRNRSRGVEHEERPAAMRRVVQILVLDE